MINRFSPSARLAFVYILISTSWVIGSDTLVNALWSDPETIALIQSVKGMFFVLLCAFIIYFVSRKIYSDINHNLNQSETLLYKYQALNKATKEGIVDYDIEKDCATVNEGLKEFLGLSGTTIPSFGEVHENWIHPEDRNRVLQSFESTLATGSPVWQAEYRCLWHDGSYHEIINRGCFIRHKKTGRPLNFICTIQDVSELRLVQAQYYEQQLRTKVQLGRSIIKAQEEERNRWAGELHDNVCQMLTVVKLYLTEMVNGRPLPPSIAQQPQVLVEKALDEIRQLSASIRPPEFATISLREALDQLISSIKRIRHYAFDVQLENLDESMLTEQHKLMIYRVVQEQISNILKYADPETILVAIESNNEVVKLSVCDDGKGFDPAVMSGGIGLRNIQSRLQVFSGYLKIDAAPGEGCKLYAQFNLN
jgi:two-component system sensor histidine kinase UhpB